MNQKEKIQQIQLINKINLLFKFLYNMYVLGKKQGLT